MYSKVIQLYIYLFFTDSFPLHYKIDIYFIYSSVYLLIPNS